MKRIHSIRLSRRSPSSRAGRVLATLEEAFKSHPDSKGLHIVIVATGPGVPGSQRRTVWASGFNTDEDIAEAVTQTAAALNRGLATQRIIDGAHRPPDAA